MAIQPQQGKRPGTNGAGLRVAGLFAGIGGIERGLHQAGHRTEFLCEVNQPAAKVLAHHFGVEPAGDVRDVRGRDVPPVDLLAGGFPCQDLSQAGGTNGISGTKSSVVNELFRLLSELRPAPRWVLLENVPFMLQLERGRAMAVLTKHLEDLKYRWAYRVVDTRAFGLPQRRHRVILLASKQEDPNAVLFADEAGPEPEFDVAGVGYGFYWTEGIRGLGWAPDSVPTLKGGSTVGIPSPPAIWMPNGAIVTPDIRDSERLQGFPAGWTESAVDDPRRRNGPRWRLVGNAVSVPVARWVGRRLARPGKSVGASKPLSTKVPWPVAAYGSASGRFRVDVSRWPVRYKYKSLVPFLKHDARPLSLRATRGFRERTTRSRLRFRDDFLMALDRHIERQAQEGAPQGRMRD